jgi:protein TonB
VIAAIPNRLPDVPVAKTPDVKPEWIKQEKVELKQPPIVTKAETPKQEMESLKQPLPLPEPVASPVKPAPLPTPPAQKKLPASEELKPIIQAALIQQASAMGSPIGNSNEADAGHIMRYEQLLAVWLHKFKQYPTEARMKNQEGTAILHLVIDREGNVLRSDLAAKTGYPLLDEAVMEMVTQAKTVPPVPDDYPGENELEFQIPVKFTLESL